MHLDANSLYDGFKYFAENAVIKPALQFAQNEYLQNNYYGRAKLIGKTMAAAYAGGIIGGVIGLPTITMLGAGIYMFKRSNENYNLFTKHTDNTQKQQMIEEVLKLRQRIGL